MSKDFKYFRDDNCFNVYGHRFDKFTKEFELTKMDEYQVTFTSVPERVYSKSINVFHSYGVKADTFIKKYNDYYDTIIPKLKK